MRRHSRCFARTRSRMLRPRSSERSCFATRSPRLMNAAGQAGGGIVCLEVSICHRFRWHQRASRLDSAIVRGTFGLPRASDPSAVSVLNIQHLRKAYGTLRAVDDVSFSVAPGELVGLLGPNGAGKTTTVSMIAGFVAPDSGDVLVAGAPLRGD